MALKKKKDKKDLFFFFYSYLTTEYLQQLKGMQSSKPGLRKRFHLSIEGTDHRKWYLSWDCQKGNRKGFRTGWTSGSPYKTLLSRPPPFPPPGLTHTQGHKVFLSTQNLHWNLFYFHWRGQAKTLFVEVCMPFISTFIKRFWRVPWQVLTCLTKQGN